jgi:predicted RecB family endonuclease
MTVYKSPGVFVKEVDISIVKHSKRYSRRIKIGKIFDIDVPNVIITSTPKGPTNFPQIW